MNKLVVYTAIFGGYNALVDQPRYSNVDYVCFTDSDIKSNCWRVIKVDAPPCGEDNTRNNRFYKIRPHLFFNEYQYSLYIDGNFVLKKNPWELVKNFISSDVKMACFDHNATLNDKRNCIYDEADFIRKIALEKNVLKDDIDIVNQHIEHLSKEGYPKQNGLIVGGVLLREHHQPEVIKVMEEWWYYVKKISKRDQLSFNFVAWKHEFKYNIIPGDIRRKNSYVFSLGKHRKEIGFALLKYRLKKLFRLV